MNIDSLRELAVLDGERLQALWDDRDLLVAEKGGLQEGLEIERETQERLRHGLKLAREWLQGWGSAEPYISRIDALLNESGGPQAPIAQITVNQAGEIAGTLMYAPGLPPGDHDLYCEPAAVARCLSVQPDG